MTFAAVTEERLREPTASGMRQQSPGRILVLRNMGRPPSVPSLEKL